MARLCAVRGQNDDCREWLEKCSHKNYLAKKTKWFSIHFANVRNEEWFMKMCESQQTERDEEMLRKLESIKRQI